MILSTETENSAQESSSSNWDTLYCTHLWTDSHLRNAILNAKSDKNTVKYCYTCKGKIRKYEVKSPAVNFTPDNYSTPNVKVSKKDVDITQKHFKFSRQNTDEPDKIPRATPSTLENNVDNNECIPTISRHVDSSFRQKYTSYEMRPNVNPHVNQRRLRKSLKGIGCVVNLALTDSPVKKRTQIQACSISIMIVAIVVISFVLVNFTTPSFTRASSVSSTTVPTEQMLQLSSNISPSTTVSVDKVLSLLTTEAKLDQNTIDSTTEPSIEVSSKEPSASMVSVLSKVRQNIRTYPKNESSNGQPKEISNRDLSSRFCSCQTNEVCMLDESSGTSLCKKAVDTEDPTGCGGLCALETEACQLVDKEREVRVCRLLTTFTCSEEEWRCRNGLCVPSDARCDGIIHCYDKSDEMHCDCDLTKSFRCGHSISCFPNTKLCNGVIDCWDGFDEYNCTVECPENQFTCNDGQCIPSSRFCDGLADCDDRTDEPHGCSGDCGAHEIKCRNQRCVPRAYRCDSRDDCGDNSDEMKCST